MALKSMLKTNSDIKLYRCFFRPILRQLHKTSRIYYFDNEFEMALKHEDAPQERQNKRRQRREALQKYETKLLADMKKSGRKISRWTKETELYLLVYKYYPDAIYQYRAPWLGRQSIDVFIPSLGVGFEYQGVQHFKAIEFFGGVDGYKATQIRDSRKKELCEENGVRIIYWNYDEPISESLFLEKLL